MSDPYGKIYKALENFVEKGSNPANKMKTLEAADKMKSLLSKYLQRVNYKYMRTVFFPEFSTGARFPSNFNSVSNVFSVRTTVTIKPSDSGSLGVMILPQVVSNSIPCIYLFNRGTIDSWGTGKPHLHNGRPSGQDSQSSTFTGSSAEIYFQKYRLIGCSVIVQPVNFTGGVLRGGVEYDVNLGTTLKSGPKEDIVWAAGFENYFYSMSFDLVRALKNRAQFITALEEKVNTDWAGTPTVKSIDMISIYNSLFKDTISVMSDSEKEKNTKDWKGFTDWVYRKLISRTVERVSEEKTEIVENKEFFFLILARILCYFNQGPTYKKAGVVYSASVRKDENSKINETVDKTEFINAVKLILDTVASRWSNQHAELISRITKDCAGGLSTEVEAATYPDGGLNFHRLQESHYFHDARAGDGIRVVLVPNKEPTWNDSTNKKQDVILVGGEGLTTSALVSIQLIRHYEGITIPGLREIFPGAREFPDNRVSRLVSAVFTLYPDLLNIMPSKLPEVYASMKKTFKWWDLVVGERGSLMDVDRPQAIQIEALKDAASQPIQVSGINIPPPTVIEEIE